MHKLACIALWAGFQLISASAPMMHLLNLCQSPNRQSYAIHLLLQDVTARVLEPSLILVWPSIKLLTLEVLFVFPCRIENPTNSQNVAPDFPIQVNEVLRTVTVQAGVPQRLLLDYLSNYT